MSSHRHFHVKKFAAFIIIAVIAVTSGLIGGFGAFKLFSRERTSPVFAEPLAEESEGTEMAKTTDRLAIDGVEYMVSDSDLKSAFDEKVNDKYTTINPTNWYNKDGFTLGILKANETVEESTVYKYTNYYIPVSPGDVIRFNRGDNFNGLYFRHIAAYDSNKNPLGSTYGLDASTISFTIPSGVSFVRVTVDVLNNMENLKPMITIGASAPTVYSAYFAPYDVITTDFVTQETAEQIAKIEGIDESVIALDEIKADTVSKHTTENLFDGNLNVGYIQKNGTVNGSTSYRYTDKIDIHDLIGQTVKVYNDGTQKYIRFVCIYDENNTVKSALGTDTNALTFTIPSGAYYAVFSFADSSVNTPYVLITTAENKTVYVPNANKWGIKDFPAVDAFVNIAEPLVLSADSLADDGELKAETGNSVKTYGTYAMFCRPGEMTDDDYIIFGKNGSNGYAVGISKTKWAWFVNGNNQGGGTHGLTIKDYLFVTVNKEPGTGAVVTIYTNGGVYTRTNTSWQDYHGLQYIKNESGDTITEVKMTWGSSAFRHGIWFFGDSYTSGSDARWPYYISQLGFSDNILINGYPGEETDIGYKDFIDCIKYGKPTIAVWCLGMNNGDNGEINATWLKYTQAFLDVCELFDITPVLATIPCCPLADHQYKNAWVRASGYRYIEFANAVNVTEDSTTWFDGMLSSDNIHPTAQGAKALASQIIVSVPEIVLK